MPAFDNPRAKVLLVGESPGYDEIAQGTPFVGAAGSMLQRVLRLIGKQRDDYRLDNTCRCVPPNMALENRPWTAEVMRTCRYLEGGIAASTPTVVVPMGAVALKRVLGLTAAKGVRVQDFHGTVSRDPTDRFWVVPTYHPSHLQRGAVNLMGVVAFDLQRAEEIAAHGWAPDPGVIVVDPPIDWFRRWAEDYIAAATSDPRAYPLAVDIETPEKGADEGDLVKDAQDHTYVIKRVNLSCHPDEGVTVPYEYPYIEVLQRVFAVVEAVRYLWFKGYDEPRLIAAGVMPPACRPTNLDLMWIWKVIQSDLPMGLGFAAPFYSRFGAWKHLAHAQPGYYAGVDGLQTRRVGDGVVSDAIASGQWDVFDRHLHRFHLHVLQPATDVGVPVDRVRLTEFNEKLEKEAGRILGVIQTRVPADLRPLTPKAGLTKPPLLTDVHTKGRATTKRGDAKKDAPDPIKMAIYAQASVVESLVLREVRVCLTCGKQEVAKTHRCQPGLPGVGGDATPNLALAVVSVRRWFWQEPFNPDSPQQLLAYVAAKGHPAGRAKKTGAPSVDRETLVKLWRDTGDPLYDDVMSYRAVGKVRGTYGLGTLRRLDSDDRLHPQTTFKPSTMRTSQVNPNLQNVIADKGGKDSLAAGFRHCVVARRSSWIVEFDFSGSEQVDMGWFMQDPNYIRIAKLGTHAIVASHELGRPAQLSWSDDDLRGYLKEIKDSKDPHVQQVYDRSKRCVHGVAYGLTTYGMCRNFPKTFPTLKAAEKIEAVYFALAPGVPEFHTVVRHTAHEQRYLGGAVGYQYLPQQKKVIGHPYGYKHWFWSVVSYDRLSESQRLWRQKRGMPLLDINGIWYGVSLGEDAKRAVAFYPQSTTRGKLTEAALPLFDPGEESPWYIGDAYYGQTPLRAPIHDSLLMEVPTGELDRVVEATFAAMRQPMRALPCPAAWGMGSGLVTGVDAKIGADWGSMSKLALPTVAGAAAAPLHEEVTNDTVVWPADEADEDEVRELETRIA